jgi:hypothetical protein
MVMPIVRALPRYSSFRVLTFLVVGSQVHTCRCVGQQFGTNRNDTLANNYRQWLTAA